MIPMIVDLIRNWHPFLQFLFFIAFVAMTSAAATSITQSISTAICRYFMQFLAIIFRGWPESSSAELTDATDEEPSTKNSDATNS